MIADLRELGEGREDKAQELAAEHGMELEQAAVTVSAVVSLTAHIGEKVDALVEQVGALTTKVDNLTTKVDNLETSVGGLTWRFVVVALGLVSSVAVVFGIALAAVRLTS